METVKLDFPDRDLYILKDGDWRGFRSSPCAKEPETVEWIRSFPEGSVLWDVGASVGPYSLIAAALGHQVLAFEPFAPSYGHLWQNIWLNGLTMISAFPIALDNQTHQLASFPIAGYEPGSASHQVNLSKYRVSQVAQMLMADDAAETYLPPNHVKIDVDGVEDGVIEGGRVLWKQVDSIMIESEPPTIDDISVILSGAGLQMVDSWKRLGDTKQHNYLFRRG